MRLHETRGHGNDPGFKCQSGRGAAWAGILAELQLTRLRLFRSLAFERDECLNIRSLLL